jgi:hypothetical protein
LIHIKYSQEISDSSLENSSRPQMLTLNKYSYLFTPISPAGKYFMITPEISLCTSIVVVTFLYFMERENFMQHMSYFTIEEILAGSACGNVLFPFSTRDTHYGTPQNFASRNESMKLRMIIHLQVILALQKRRLTERRHNPP